MKYPKVLVVANNSFSLTSSNGRALGNLFIGWPKDSLAEFCISTDGPNYELCSNYYCITDYAALRSCLNFREAKAIDLNSLSNLRDNNVGASGKVRKTALKALIRNCVWMTGLWKGKEFNSWVDSFSPDIVMIQNTDSAFMLKIGHYIAKRKDIPIVFYNTEGHYFFKTPYTHGGKFDNLIYKVYRMLYTKVFDSVFSVAKLVIHCNHLLKEDFDSAFSVPSEVIYISSFLKPSSHLFDENNPRFSYLGDFCNGRTPVLIELANILNSIQPAYKLDVYGNGNDIEKKQLKSCKNVDYKGFVSYDEVVKIMDETDLLFHVESQDKKWYDPLQYGFSAKIADTLTMAKPFIQYSFDHNAGAQYLKQTKAGWFVSNVSELKSTIIHVINNAEEREERRKNALVVSQKNHRSDINRAKFLELLKSVVTNK